MKITINNEEVLCNKDFTINEEMLNTSSVILNNVYPKTWEQDKDYVSRFYYPKDYSKCKIFDEIVHPATREDIEGTSFSINVDTTKQYEIQTLKGQTSQSGTPTPTSPQPINITTGRQVVSVCEKNLFDKDTTNYVKGYYLNNNGVETSGTNWGVYYIPVKSNTAYSISGCTTNTGTYFWWFDSNKQPISMIGSKKNYTNITSPSNASYIGLSIVWNTTSSAYDGTTFMLEVGTTATTYEEYKGNDYEINLGKNLFRPNILTQTKNGMTITNNGDGSYTLNGTTTATANFVDDSSSWYTFQQGTYYIGCNDFTNITIASYYGNGSIGFWKTSPGTFTLSTDAERFRIQITIASGITFNNKIIKPMIEKGSVGTSYSPYKTPIELCKIGNYQDYIFRNTTENPLYDSNLEEGQWYIHKEIGRVVFNGSENWQIRNDVVQTGYTCFRNGSYVINSRYNASLITNLYCNYFMPTSGSYGATPMLRIINANEYGETFMFPSSIASTVADFKTWVSNHNIIIYYYLITPTNTLIEDEELINQLNSIELLDGLNNVSITSPYLPFVMSLMYNYQEGYTEEELYFCGIVKNTGEISLNPRHPHYCNIQVLDFKDFLSQGETLDFVITEKTIGEAIDQVIGTIAPYGFIKGNILLDDIDELMGTYSTKDKTAYDVFNYIADITQSRWTTRMVDENTIAIDYFDPNKLPLGEQIEYNQTWFRNHKIDDLSYSYSSNDYRNKQVMLSGEVYSNIETTEILVADGYQTQFNTIDKIGKVSSLLLNGTPVSIITKEEYDLGYDADFYYQPGNKYFESVNLVSTGAILTIVYYAIIEGREVILNQDEISLIEERTGRKGVVARYENRNDATTTGELQAIGQSYLEYKGIPEIKLNVSSRENTWNIGDRVYFNAPLDELKQTYMVKAKKVQRITTIDELFYQYELTSSFNMEQDINYFDNQRYKSRGNIGEGEFISRNIDIENTANVIFYDLEVQEVEVEGNSTLQSELQSVLGGVE